MEEREDDGGPTTNSLYHEVTLKQTASAQAIYKLVIHEPVGRWAGPTVWTQSVNAAGDVCGL